MWRWCPDVAEGVMNLGKKGSDATISLVTYPSIHSSMDDAAGDVLQQSHLDSDRHRSIDKSKQS